MAVNKVIYGDQTLMDLTGDTVTADKLLSGATAHNASGEQITGSMIDNSGTSGTISTASNSFTIPQGYHDGQGTVSISENEQVKIIPENIKAGVEILGVTGTASGGGTDTSDATAGASDILAGQTAYVDGEKVTGTMINRGQVTGSMSYANDVFAISQGYHDGTGSVTIDSAEQAKIIPENIKSGVRILGVDGSCSGGGVDTSGDTVTANRMLAGTTAHDANGNAITGTMTNRGSVAGAISTVNGSYTIPQGYHDGTGTVQISASERAKITPEIIKEYEEILGVQGSLKVGSDTSEDTVEADLLFEGITAHDWRGQQITGTIPDQSGWGYTFTNFNDNLYVNIPAGYHNGDGYVGIDSDLMHNVESRNIRRNVVILGVEGTLTGIDYDEVSKNRENFSQFRIDDTTSMVTQLIYDADATNVILDEYAVEAGEVYNGYLGGGYNICPVVFSTVSTLNRTETINNCIKVAQNSGVYGSNGFNEFYFYAPVNGYIIFIRNNNKSTSSLMRLDIY